MRPQDSQQGRRSNRGARRPRRNGADEYDNRQNGASRAPEKKTLWQKIAAFFGGKKVDAPSRANGSRRAPERSPDRRNGKPEFVEVTSPKLYVGNLSFDATESDLFDLFNGVGIVKNAEIVSNKYTQKSKGFAFVTMQTVEEARRAVTELHDKDFMGRKLLVNGARTSDFHSDRGDR